MADYIICNGKIVNGKNEAPFEGNIIIEGSRIKEITKTAEIPSDFPKERILDAKGGYVTPGFIDIHRHGDWQAAESFHAYMDALKATKRSVNTGM